jgi:hypothetical protein
MIQQIIQYLINKLDNEKLFQKNYSLTNLIDSGGKIFPLFYESNGKYKLDFNPNKWFGVSYFRKDGDISFSDGTFPSLKPQEMPVSIRIPLKFIGTIKKDKLLCDDNYSSDNLALYIIKLFQDINSMRVDLRAKRVTFNVDSYTTDGKAIMDEEFNGFDVALKTDYAYISLSLYIEIQTTKECMFDYCPSVIIDENSDKVIDQFGDNLIA